MRLFTAIELSPEAEQRVKEVQSRLKQQLKCRSWQSLENLHITLNFLGDADEASVEQLLKELSPAIERFHPFQLGLRKLGVFPHEQRPRIIYLGVGGETQRLQEMQKSLATVLTHYGYGEADKTYTPHITLAREPQGTVDLSSLNGELPDEVNWLVDRVTVFQSEFHSGRAVHTILQQSLLK
ncbi:MAG TPA: RNA 2',3'-cyclic phosphodiesterase [Bacilli bacterium]